MRHLLGTVKMGGARGGEGGIRVYEVHHEIETARLGRLITIDEIEIVLMNFLAHGAIAPILLISRNWVWNGVWSSSKLFVRLHSFDMYLNMFVCNRSVPVGI
jgi:hypothetical protein